MDPIFCILGCNYYNPGSCYLSMKAIPSWELCVEWGSPNTSWHINVHHVKNLHTLKCEVEHNGDMGMGHLWLLMGGALSPNGLGVPFPVIT